MVTNNKSSQVGEQRNVAKFFSQSVLFGCEFIIKFVLILHRLDSRSRSFSWSPCLLLRDFCMHSIDICLTRDRGTACNYLYRANCCRYLLGFIRSSRSIGRMPLFRSLPSTCCCISCSLMPCWVQEVEEGNVAILSIRGARLHLN